VQTLWRHSGARSPTAMGAEGWGGALREAEGIAGAVGGGGVKITANLKLI